MDWLAIAALAVGWVAQFAKAYKQVPTPIVQVLCMGVGFGCYAMCHHYAANDAQWFQNGIAWAMAVPGMSSFAAGAGLAPKTDSINAPHKP